MKRIGLTLVLMMSVVPGLGAQDAPGVDQPKPLLVNASVLASPYAWDLSLAFETAGDVRGARTVMVNRYGARPGSYVPCVRLAWLNLQLGDVTEAIALYRRARALDDSQTEAPAGLALALTRVGYLALERGDYPMARRSWEEALVHEPLNQSAKQGLTLVGRSDEIAPEVWIGHINASQNSSSSNVLYAALPVRVNPWLTLRAAFRSVGTPSAALNTVPFFGSQREMFGGVQVEHGRSATEVVGFRLTNDVSSSNGAAVGLRVGGRAGATMMASAIQTTAGSNIQVAPSAYRWVRPSLRLSLGTRVTRDSALTGVSGLLGATWHGRQADVDVRIHAGTERWAFDLAGPTILSFLAQTSGGGSVTGSVPFASGATLSVQAQMERIVSTSLGDGWYRSIAIGMRFVPKDGTRR
ncbi:MAG: hypothetical protein IPP90_15585 [Gemmatimonadaceae bacterium]|nr:hypothetical protein [Gemmatimonadaceae bacterium]